MFERGTAALTVNEERFDVRFEFLLARDLASVRQSEPGLLASEKVPILDCQRRARDDDRFALAGSFPLPVRPSPFLQPGRERLGVDPLQRGMQLVFDSAVFGFVGSFGRRRVVERFEPGRRGQ